MTESTKRTCSEKRTRNRQARRANEGPEERARRVTETRARRAAEVLRIAEERARKIAESWRRQEEKAAQVCDLEVPELFPGTGWPLIDIRQGRSGRHAADGLPPAGPNLSLQRFLISTRIHDMYCR